MELQSRSSSAINTMFISEKKIWSLFFFFSPEYSNLEMKQVLLKLKTVRNLLLEIAFD